MANASRIQLSSMANGSLVVEGLNTPAWGETAYIYYHGTTTQAPVYTSETGSGEYTQPLTADANGQLPGWVPGGVDLDVWPEATGTPEQLEPLVSSSVGNKSPEYLIYASSGTVYALNCASGAIDYSTTGDPAVLFQGVANALYAGSGGTIEFKGEHVFQSQLVLKPGVGLRGTGPLTAQPPQATGSIIKSSYNGSVIVLTGDAAGDTFIDLRDFAIIGDLAQAAQNLIEVNNSGGGVLKDAFLTRVLAFQAGQHGIFYNNDGKIWIDKSYLESCAGDGLNANSGTVAFSNGYVFGNSGHGLNANTACGLLSIQNNRIWQNGAVAGKYGVRGGSGTIYLIGNDLNDNGANGDYQTQFALDGGVITEIEGNQFIDTRGASAVSRHIGCAISHTQSGHIIGNSFSGQKNADPIYVQALAGNTLIIANNDGVNNKVGKLATPFDATGRMGIEGTVAAPTASTTYKGCSPLYLAVSGGNGVSMAITDPAGNTVQSGLSSFTGLLPVGYGINFGAFTVAPTVYCGVA